MMLGFPLLISLLFCKRSLRNIHSQSYAVLFAGELSKEIDVVFSYFCQATEAEKGRRVSYLPLLTPLYHVFSGHSGSPFPPFFGRFSVLKKPFLILSYITHKTVLPRNKKNEN